MTDPITINEARMKLRKDRRYIYESIEEGQRGEDGDYIAKDFADWREIPSEALEQKQLRETLMKAVNSLPEKYRVVFMLRDVEQLSIAETMQALGISEANVKTRLSRARLQLRDVLAPVFEESLNSTTCNYVPVSCHTGISNPKVPLLPVVEESVPVYEGKVLVQQEVVVCADRAFIASITQPRAMPLKGPFFY